MIGPLPPGLGKVEAAARLAQQAGLAPAANSADVAALLARLPVLANPGVTLRPSAQVPNATRRAATTRLERAVAPPRHTNSRPAAFPSQSGWEISPALDVIEVRDGVVARIDGAPVLLADPVTVVADASSAYAGLVHGLEIDVARIARDARVLPGAALVLLSDIEPANYCHWLLDELPRLAALGGAGDVTVVISDADAPFCLECLRLCGVQPERIITLADGQAVRARRLLATSDLTAMPHPAFKAAPWAMDFLRARIGFAALAGGIGGTAPRRLFVSRDDARGRRIVNEHALMGALSQLGYTRVTLAGLSVPEQVALFSRAERVLGAHGAGLANIVFAPPGASLIEIFPASYGTPTYYVLAAGRGLGYATYVARDIVPGDRAQTDDLRLDIDDFVSRCGALL